MKHAGNAASLRPAAERARNQGRGPRARRRRSAGAGREWIGPWRLDSDERGRLVAVNTDTGAVTVLAE